MSLQDDISKLEAQLAALRAQQKQENAQDVPYQSLPVPQAPPSGTLPAGPPTTAAMPPAVTEAVLAQANTPAAKARAMTMLSSVVGGTPASGKASSVVAESDKSSPRTALGDSVSQAAGTEDAKNLKRDAAAVTAGSEESAAKVARLMLTQPELTNFRNFLGALTAATANDQLSEIAKVAKVDFATIKSVWMQLQRKKRWPK